MDDIFKALSDSNRRKILAVLKKRDMAVSEIAGYLNVTGATLSHHLDILKRARLIVSERQGQFIRYSLNTSVFEESVKMIMDIFMKGKK